jgi:hypothetical protein
MRIKARTRGREKTLAEIRQELTTLKSGITSIVGKDTEGRYRDEFVREVLEAAREKPTHTYKGSGSFFV